MYSKKILDVFYDPQNVGVIKGASGMGKVESTTCGDIVRLYISVENDHVVNAKFQTYGSAPSIACSAKATELVIGKSIDQALEVSSQQIEDELDGLPDDKKYCAELAQCAIIEAVEDFYRKQKGEKKPRKKLAKKLN